MDFLLREVHRVQINARRANEPSPYNHHLKEFLTFLKRERVRRRHDRQPRLFSEALSSLANLIRRTTVRSVTGDHCQILHECRGWQVEADNRFVPCTVPALVLPLCQESRLVRVRHCPIHRRTLPLHLRKYAASRSFLPPSTVRRQARSEVDARSCFAQFMGAPRRSLPPLLQIRSSFQFSAFVAR